MTERRPAGRTTGMRSRNNQTRPRAGVASKELQAARRRKRQREVMRNRIIFGVICLALVILIIFLISKVIGAVINSGAVSDSSTITFEDDGSVVFDEVTDFDTEVYSKSELKSYTKDLIKSFNETNGDESITLDRFKVSGDKAYIKTTYKDAETYSAFTSYESYNGSYEDAYSAGYNFDEVFCTVADSKKSEGATVDAASTFAGQQVAIIKENVTVNVPGTITYVSETSTEIIDDNTVSIKQADGNNDATDLVYIVYSAK